MVDFSAFVPEDGLPIYLQIIRHVKRAIAAGAIQAGDELPSRRMLSAQLGVNPNTVQKAYKLLEDEGIISSRSGAKSELSLSPQLAEQIRAQLLEQEARLLIGTLRQAGLEKDAALSLLDRLWDTWKEDIP